MVLELIRQSFTLAIGPELTNFPMKLARHRAVGIHTSELRNMGIRFTGMLDYLLHR